MALSVRAYLVLVALVALQRVAELALSRKHIAAARTAGRAVEREPAFVAMVAVHVGVLVAAPVETIALHRPFVPPLAAVAVLVLLCAQVARVWVLRTLASAWTVRIVRPTAIVTEGPYRFVRHPNYLVVIVELVALPLVHTAWLTAALGTVLNAVVLSRRIALEEYVLAQNPVWRVAFDRVPRVIPKWPRPASRV